MEVIIETTKGNLGVDLFEEEAPKTVANFLRLAHQGFYDNLEFFRLVPEFVIQTGCPRNDGTGNAGYFIKCELNAKELETGSLAMAHCGRNTGSSQFFVCLSDRYVEGLQGNHTIFGVITSGLDNLNELTLADKIITVKL